MASLRPVRPAVWRSVVLLAMAAASACVTPASTVPDQLLGVFVDDYGNEYTVTAASWVQDRSQYEIRHWSSSDQFLVALNDSLNPSAGGQWTRIDWVELDGTDGYQWAYCYTAYEAASEEAARAHPPAQRDTPRTGCNGFPFSRMRRAATSEH